MDGSDSDAAGAADEAPEQEEAGKVAQAEADADRAAEGLRGQIAALRKQVKDAQDTLRDHHHQRETRSFKS